MSVAATDTAVLDDVPAPAATGRGTGSASCAAGRPAPVC